MFGHRRRTARRGPGSYYRQAFAEGTRLSVTDASAVAREWADWATSVGNVEEAAEAYWRLVNQVPEEVSRRLTWTARADVIAAGAGTAAESGYWLLRAGRIRDAAVAVELARAILIRQRVQRIPPDLETRLDRIRRLDLYSAYVRAADRLDDVQRRQHGGGVPDAVPPLVVGDARYWTGGVSAAQAAWSDYERALQDVRNTLGEDAIVRPDYGLLRSAASETPLAYIAAAERGGYAIVIRPGSDEPLPLLLKDLSLESVEVVLENYRAVVADSLGSAARLDDILGWLWTAIMSAVVTALPNGTALTIVPVGPLCLLPLHAAAEPSGKRGPRRYACDRLAIRYVPSAYALLTSKRTWTAAGSGPALAVDAPAVPGHPRLSRAADETRAVQDLLRPHCLRLADARVHDVAGRLDSTSVWHFACHGHADTTDPLNSSLVLTDRAMTLRQILSLPMGKHRLAVLSACETSVPDHRRYDEVISFPGALLQAGVASVIATSWQVEDTAAMCLVLKFYSLWLHGRPTVFALAAAQRWIRDATNAQIQALLPRLYSKPENVPAEAWGGIRRFAAPRYWASFSLTGY